LFVCSLFSVFCFLGSLIPLKMSSLKCFNKLVIISNIREGKVVNAQNYAFYFESDIAKIFRFRPTCSSYDSEIIKKNQKEPKRTSKESEQMWQTWINSVHVWDLLILVIVRVLCVSKTIILILCRHCHLCVSVVTQIRFQCWPFIYAFIVEL
jgi:hypothetical protein